MLPAPNLDDRRFQDLVDDAKRFVQQRCPTWTDHNVSDPGVTLIELVAWMTDQIVYRLNRVPDRLYVRFLELLGLELYPATSARVPVTFWLSSPQTSVIRIPSGTEVATLRTEADAAITFATEGDLDVVAVELVGLASGGPQGSYRNHNGAIADGGVPFYCLGEPPVEGNAVYFGLSDAAPSCAVTLRFRCRVEGVGVDCSNPPLAWEAWTGERWLPCELESDGTCGLNRDGDVVLHIPAGHVVSFVNNQRAGWIRARITPPVEGQPRYSSSPRIDGVIAFTVGGTAMAAHGETISDEVIGVSDGTAGQRFRLARGPVVASDGDGRLESSSDDGWVEWVTVESFASSGPSDLHVHLAAESGEVVFGPTVRMADGTVRQYGAVPPRGATLRMRRYRIGGGSSGNVARGAVCVLKSSVPYVARVVNRKAATGGVEAEDLEAAKQRGPLSLRTRQRAVTPEDYEHLAREAAPEIARVRCLPADGTDAVRVLLVPPAAADEIGRRSLESLAPSRDVLARVSEYLDARRVLGARFIVTPARYQGVTVVARLRARPRADLQQVERAANQAVYGYLDPLHGGPDSTGWPFDRPVTSGEIYAVLQRVGGVELVEEVRLFPADPVRGDRSEVVPRVDLPPGTLVFSYDHQIRVERAQ